MRKFTDWETKETAPVWIENMKGVQRILDPKEIGLMLKNRKLKSFGILIDANSSCASRYQRIHQILKEFVGDIPDQLPSSGLVCGDKERRFGVWIMPDNSSSGTVEDFLLKLIPESQKPLFQEIRENVLRVQEESPFKEHHLSKALVYSWLAIQNPPSYNLLKAFAHCSFDPMHCEASSFVNWFLNLYELNRKE